MNLTKLHKQAIVMAVIADVPRQFKDLYARAQELIAADVQKYAPKEIAVIAKDPALAYYLGVASNNIGYLTLAKKYDGDFGNVYLSYPSKHEISDTCRAALGALVEQARVEVKAIEAAKQSLYSSIAGIRTVKAFVTQFPELAKYAPDEPTMGTNLPAIANVMAGLVTLGWPKGKETAEVAA